MLLHQVSIVVIIISCLDTFIIFFLGHKLQVWMTCIPKTESIIFSGTRTFSIATLYDITRCFSNINIFLFDTFSFHFSIISWDYQISLCPVYLISLNHFRSFQVRIDLESNTHFDHSSSDCYNQYSMQFPCCLTSFQFNNSTSQLK